MPASRSPTTKTCRQCQAGFEVTEDDLKFLDKVSPVFAGKKEPIPPPTLCPSCREQRRFSFRNERKLYRRTCAKTGTPIVSVYSPEKPFIVYDPKVWWSDTYDPLAYGREFDVNRSFFEQFHSLNLAVPKAAIQNANSEHSEFTNYSHDNKNCFMVIGSYELEDCAYCYRSSHSSNVFDCYDLVHSELCYECSQGKNLYGCTHCQQSSDCSACSFCFDCIGCRDCYGCTGLRNKQYVFFNVPLSKEEYMRKLREITPSDATAKNIRAVSLSVPHRATILINCEDCTGDQLFDSRRCRESFDLLGSEDCRFCAISGVLRDSYDANFADDCQLQYESTNLHDNYRTLFGFLVWYCKESIYTVNSFHSMNLFGCSGMKKHQYCILNKQYTKEEYERLVPQIIEHMRNSHEWGEFFPAEISPFAYNETVAQEYFPLTKEQAEKRGWGWREEKDELPKVTKVIPAEKLPDAIDDIPDDILNWAIECEATKRPFKIIKQELEFYRQMKLPVPHFHPDERHRRRMALRNPRKLWNRPCMKCGKEMETTYSPERPEIVYCEHCYLEEVY